MHQKKHLFKILSKQEKIGDMCHENSDLLESQLGTDSEDSDQRDDIQTFAENVEWRQQQLEKSSKSCLWDCFPGFFKFSFVHLIVTEEWRGS